MAYKTWKRDTIKFNSIYEDQIKQFIWMQDYLPDNVSKGDYTVKWNDLFVELWRNDNGVDVKVMSDNTCERASNADFVVNATGDILMTGLGLGWTTLMLQEKPEVTKINVVEISQDVIDLITEHITFNEKVNIIKGDINKFTTDNKYDLIWLDFWDGSNKWNIDSDMVELKSKFTPLLKENGILKNWHNIKGIHNFKKYNADKPVPVYLN